jgi:uncharacterized protein (DUF885 family)
MRNPILFLVFAAGCYLIPCTALTAEPAPTETRLAAQNALFEAQFQSDLKTHPEFATSIGDYRYNNQLDDYSLVAIARAHADDEAFLARLRAIATTGFSEQDTLSHEVMLRMLRQRIDDYRFKEYEMPVNQMNGPHVDLADLPLAVPFNSLKQYEDYIARLHQIPRVFLETEEVLRAGLKDGLMPVRFLLEKVPVQCQGVVAADPFLLPTRKYPVAITAAEQQRLTREITESVTNEVLPAYRAFADFIATQYAPHGRTGLSVSSLPGGERRYVNDIHRATSVRNLTPAQIHEIGLREIDRIEGERLALAHKAGFADVASFRKSIETDPKYRPTSAQQIVDDFRHYIDQMQPKLPGLFGYIPGSPVTVEAIPDFQSASPTHYQTGTPDGKRPGRVVVATSNFAQRTLINDEATAYHEGIPGHHMQLSVAQRMTSLPKFRQHVHISGYIEGWALYAEQLGKEIGFYQDPGSDYGRLTSELFRAARLVVDTGLHSQGWTREQVVELLRKTGLDEPMVQSESDRYIAWPAQALSYKLGQLKFRELRARAQRKLGAKFDIRSFHDEMLSGGVLPLDLLEARTDSWIRAQQHAQ